MVFAHLALSILQMSPLHAYLSKPDAAYRYDEKSAVETTLVSQRWKGVEWTHSLRRSNPQKLGSWGVAVLLITGDRVDRSDLPYSQRIADAATMPVYTLFDIPNQPLWGKVEDDLIAYTFEEYLKTNEADWPLLLPMTKSAIRAMDAIQAITKSSSNPINRFIITGASKRGWTTWLVGALNDPRVVGLAPMVFDNLNFKAQLEHQRKLWGKLSPMLADYEKRGLDQILDTEPGKKLVAIVDPYAHRSRYSVPILNIVGTNDPYWAPDSHQLYADLNGQAMCVIPNRGHNLGGDEIPALGEFARRVGKGSRIPVLMATFKGLSYSVSSLTKVGMVMAESDTMDFVGSKWKVTTSNRTGVLLPSPKNRAIFFRDGNLTTGVTLIPKSR